MNLLNSIIISQRMYFKWLITYQEGSTNCSWIRTNFRNSTSSSCSCQMHKCTLCITCMHYCRFDTEIYGDTKDYLCCKSMPFQNGLPVTPRISLSLWRATAFCRTTRLSSILRYTVNSITRDAVIRGYLFHPLDGLFSILGKWNIVVRIVNC